MSNLKAKAEELEMKLAFLTPPVPRHEVERRVDLIEQAFREVRESALREAAEIVNQHTYTSKLSETPDLLEKKILALIDKKEGE